MRNDEKDPLGARMKTYERTLSSLALDPSLPTYARIDGRSFSKLTRHLKLEKPRDPRFEAVLQAATRAVMKETNACLGYVQSDEVSLFWPAVTPPSQLMFDGKIEKLCSVVASAFASSFRHHFAIHFPGVELPEIVSFDTRFCNLPHVGEGANMLLWRYKDAVRNEITDAAHKAFGAKKLHGVSTREKVEMLGQPTVKGGTFYKPIVVDVGNGVMRGRIAEVTEDFGAMSYVERALLIFGEVPPDAEEPAPVELEAV